MKAQLYALLRMADTVYIDGYTADQTYNNFGFISGDDHEPVIFFDDQEVELSDTCQAIDKDGKQRTLHFKVITDLNDGYLSSPEGAFNYGYWSKQ